MGGAHMRQSLEVSFYTFRVMAVAGGQRLEISFYIFRSMAVAGGGQRLQISLRVFRLIAVAGVATFTDKPLQSSFDVRRRGEV